MSMAVSAVTMMGAGAINGVIGSYYGAKSQKRQLEFAADMAERNAKMSEQGAQGALLQGQRQEQGVRLKTAQIKSAQRVGMAANGIDLGSDTAVELQTSADTMGEIDALTVRDNALRAAWGYRTQGLNYNAEATMGRATASGISPGMSAFSSALTGASQVAGSWYFMDRAGAFNSPKAG